MNIKLYISKKYTLKILSVICCCVIFIVSGFFLKFFANNNKNNNLTNNSENSTEFVKLPVIMYHFVLKNSNTKNKFTISENTFEEDLKYIKNNNYTTILVQDLINYTENKTNLPEKPILLTFDDGAYNNYLYAFPLAKKYNMKFVFSPICHETEKYSQINDENPNYSYANWTHIQEMSNSNLIEIQNHTYNLHSCKKSRLGCTKQKNESDTQYEEILTQDIQKAQNLIKNYTNFEPTAMFYPFGATSKNTDNIIKKLNFKASFLCEDKINIITRNPDCLYNLKRFLRKPGVSSEKFFNNFEK